MQMQVLMQEQVQVQVQVQHLATFSLAEGCLASTISSRGVDLPEPRLARGTLVYNVFRIQIFFDLQVFNNDNKLQGVWLKSTPISLSGPNFFYSNFFLIY